MQVTLQREHEQFIADQLAAGRFATPEDAVAEAINLLRWETECSPEDIAAVGEGLAQLERGEGIPFEEVRRRFER